MASSGAPGALLPQCPTALLREGFARFRQTDRTHGRRETLPATSMLVYRVFSAGWGRGQWSLVSRLALLRLSSLTARRCVISSHHEPPFFRPFAALSPAFTLSSLLPCPLLASLLLPDALSLAFHPYSSLMLCPPLPFTLIPPCSVPAVYPYSFLTPVSRLPPLFLPDALSPALPLLLAPPPHRLQHNPDTIHQPTHALEGCPHARCPDIHQQTL